MMKLQMNMKINNYIKAKQHYIPPIIEILEVEEECSLQHSIEVDGDDITSGDGQGGNPAFPFPGTTAKDGLFYDDYNDDFDY